MYSDYEVDKMLIARSHLNPERLMIFRPSYLEL